MKSISVKAELKHALREFFMIRDSKFTIIVEDLFRLYDLEDIAYGIYRKYGILPEIWRHPLLQSKYNSKKKINLDWFVPKKMLWLSSKSPKYPPIDRPFRAPSRTRDYDRVIDEFIEKEMQYLNTLESFRINYINELISISSGRVGVKAQNALGLSERQVDYMFKEQFDLLTTRVRRWSVKAGTLYLVQNTPKLRGGRPEQFANLFIEEGRELSDAYATYFYRFRNVVKEILDIKSKTLFQFSESHRGEEFLPNLNYLELWREISAGTNRSPVRQLEDFLIEPSKRYVNYKLFIEGVQKKCGKDHPAATKIHEAKLAIEAFLQHINEAGSRNDLEERVLTSLLSS